MAKSHTGESMSQPDSMPSQPPRLDAAPPAAPPDVPATQAAARKQWLFLLRLTLLVLLVVLSFKLVRAGLFAMSAYNSAAELRLLSRSGDLAAADLAQAQTSVAEAARSVASLERELRLFAPVLRGAKFVPRLGPTVAAIPELLIAGRELSLIASEGLRLTAEAQAAAEAAAPADPAEAPLTRAALAAMADNPEAFAFFAERAAVAQTALDHVDAAAVLPSLAEPVAQLQSALQLAAAGLEMSPALPELLGYYGPRNYLLLVQNNQELRPTGGFISAVGLLSLHNGEPGDLDFTDSYNIRRDDVDHPTAPAPMRQHMGIELMFVRDSNWSPDLPTTAELVRALYTQDTGQAVDGVITVDLRVVELLVDALGPLEVKGADVPITGDNLIEQIIRFWDQPVETGDTIESAGQEEWWKQRKDFMPALAQAALNRVRGGHFNPLRLLDAARVALDERAIQVWLANPTSAATLAAQGWDGGLQPQAGADLLALVDTNMGYNKVDAVLQRSLAYTVTWPDGPAAPALAEAAVTYVHPQEAPGYVCDPRPCYGNNYADMIKRCYFDYVRLYVPAGSELIEIAGVEPDSVDAGLGENGTQVFAGFFQMLPGAEHVVRFRYRLPPQITPPGYTLLVRRQSGAGPLPLRVDVNGRTLDTVVKDGALLWSPAAGD